MGAAFLQNLCTHFSAHFFMWVKGLKIDPSEFSSHSLDLSAKGQDLKFSDRSPLPSAQQTLLCPAPKLTMVISYVLII
jgi:hypothetical protein